MLEDQRTRFGPMSKMNAGCFLRLENPFAEEAEMLYDCHLRALLKARVDWEVEKEKQQDPVDETAEEKQTAVKFVLPDNQRSDEQQRAQIYFHRPNRWYEAGKWASESTEGFWDTSGCYDLDWEKSVALETIDEQPDEDQDSESEEDIEEDSYELEESMDITDMAIIETLKSERGVSH